MTISPSERLKFERFGESDDQALAELLADSSITRNITANGSTPERCLASARKRITWHNSSWQQYRYGVWSLRARKPELAPADRLLGWCGFIPPDDDDPDAEILYALHADFRGKGLATEAARHAISWLFEATPYQGVTAVISTPFNPGSVGVVTKLGMNYRNRMAFSLFISESELADDVAEYEIWRLANDSTQDTDSLIEQVAFRTGQLSRVTSLSAEQLLGLLSDSLLEHYRQKTTEKEQDRHQALMSKAFTRGCNDAYMDCYHVTRDQWPGSK
jgi:RimJ/RimL family protein N-acetyltransferase